MDKIGSYLKFHTTSTARWVENPIWRTSEHTKYEISTAENLWEILWTRILKKLVCAISVKLYLEMRQFNKIAMTSLNVSFLTDMTSDFMVYIKKIGVYILQSGLQCHCFLQSFPFYSWSILISYKFVMRKLELLILRDLSERLYMFFLLLKFDLLLINYWPRKILEYFRNWIIGNLSNLFR